MLRKYTYSLLIFLLIGAAGCNKDVPPPDTEITGQGNKDEYALEFLNAYNLDIAEPSGLSPALNSANLIVVDDHTNQAFIISTKGKNMTTLNYQGDDTEGVTTDAANGIYWIAEEAESKIIKLDSLGNKLAEYKIDIERTSSKKGLEGISYDALSRTFYILNEGEPGLLIKWSVSGGIMSKKELKFALDYSGIFYDKTDESLWIVSDQSQKVFHCTKDGIVRQSFDLDFPKAEGIVINRLAQRMYIVSDSEHKLYTYKINKL
jgi:uncharacterized protein YjiK